MPEIHEIEEGIGDLPMGEEPGLPPVEVSQGAEIISQLGGPVAGIFPMHIPQFLHYSACDPDALWLCLDFSKNYFPISADSSDFPSVAEAESQSSREVQANFPKGDKGEGGEFL